MLTMDIAPVRDEDMVSLHPAQATGMTLASSTSPDEGAISTADASDKSGSGDSRWTSTSTLWSRTNSSTSNPSDSGSSEGGADTDDDRHFPWAMPEAGHALFPSSADNEALRETIIQLEEERARLQEILRRHKLQRKQNPRLCRCRSSE